mgnify:CR=1 FL=1
MSPENGVEFASKASAKKSPAIAPPRYRTQNNFLHFVAARVTARVYMKSLIIAEKPSVAADLAKALGKIPKKGEHYENDEFVISFALGHLVDVLHVREGSVQSGCDNRCEGQLMCRNTASDKRRKQKNIRGSAAGALNNRE